MTRGDDIPGAAGLLTANKNIPLRYRCKVGGEWKNLGDFSAAQQKNLQRLLDAGRHIDAAHSGMACLEHAANNRQEIRCDLCGLYKSLDDYSKNSRRNGERTCKRCIAWTETQEPDVTPGPLETGHISPEEEFAQISRQTVWTIDGLLSDAASSRPGGAPVSALNSLGLDDELYRRLLEDDFLDLTSLTGRSSTSTQSSTNNILPPHLRHKVPSSSASVVSEPENSLPPHLRAKIASRAASVKDDAASVSSSTDMSLPTTLREAASESGSTGARSFNAWDSSGTQHRLRQAGRSTSTSETASVIEDLQDDPNVVGDWEDTAPVFQRATRKGGWNHTGDSRLTRTELLASEGETYQSYISQSIDRQIRYRPLDEDDSD